MGIITGKMLKKLVDEKKLIIDPFYEDGVQPASYDARLGHRILVGPTMDKLGDEVDLNKERAHLYEIETGQFVSIITEEIFKLPNDMCGRFGLRSSYTRKGLILFGGIQLDPGWRGRIVASLTNVGPEPIELKMGDKIVSVEFHKLEEAAEPYSGPHQNQLDFPEEDRKCIVEAKTTTLAKIPMLEREISKISGIIERLKLIGPDPFDISLNEFKKLSFDEWRSHANRAHELCRKKVEEALKKAEFVVVCDGKVILTTNDRRKVSGEELTNLMEKLKKPCYVFSRPLIIEESPWSVVRDEEDYYPTIEMLIGQKNWDAKMLIKNGRRLIADFDTGNPYDYLILDWKLVRDLYLPPFTYNISQHLQRRYFYFWGELHIGILDTKKNFRSRKLWAQFVLDWERSPFIIPSPQRKGFIGRYIMFNFGLKITLNPKSKTSVFEYIN